MGRNSIKDCRIIEIPKIYDPRGSLSVIENSGLLPYDVQRVYYIYDIPAGVVRGGHSHKECKEFLVALSGSFEVVLKDGKEEKRVTLNRPDRGLLITSGIWRELENFSSGSVCLVLSSEKYSEDDYIRDFDTYLDLVE